MSAVSDLENNLNDVFGRRAPTMPAGGKKFFVEFLPWLALLGGVLSLLAAWSLWHWARYASQAAEFVNNLAAVYGTDRIDTNRFTLGIWLAIAVLVVEGVLYVLAFNDLRRHHKDGWNKLFYALLINIVYGVVVMFTDYGGVGSLVGSLIGAAIGMWILFQIRPAYSRLASTHRPAQATVTPADDHEE
jgi:hypothetical protein